jgi:CRISPR-associated protein Cas6
VIKNFTEPETFLQAVEKQLAKLEIEAKIELPLDTFNRARRKVISIQKRKIVGFSLAVHELSQKDSLALQINGLGGKRHMGCGIFNPISERVFL